MNTVLKYLNDTYSCEGYGKLISMGSDEKGDYAIFDETIFYPRGGGQDSDKGVIEFLSGDNSIAVDFVGFFNGQVLHYGKFSKKEDIDVIVRQRIDQENRLQNSALHTGGHLIASIVENLDIGLVATKGFHFAEGPYIEFEVVQSNKTDDYASYLPAINQQIAYDIGNSLKVTSEILNYDQLASKCRTIPRNIPNDKPLRAVTIDGYFPIPCGGTHLGSIAEIDVLVATKLKFKKGALRVSYSLERKLY